MSKCSSLSTAALLAVPLLATCATAAGPDAKALGRAIDAYAKPLVEAGHLSGQLLVAKDGKIVVERTYGQANFELAAPVTAETRFCIASVTKPMTTIVAIQLMSEKKLGYKDELAKWLPDFPAGSTITIEHLLRHRSGIPHRVTTVVDETRPMTAADVAACAAQATLEFTPGEKSSYSSGGFSVLARVLELAGGKTYDDLLRERVLAPLGMSHTQHADGRSLLPGRAESYMPVAAGFANAPPRDLSFLVGAGSVWSTAEDLHRLVQGVTTGKMGEGARQSFVRGGKLHFNGYTNGFIAYADWDSASSMEVIFAGNVHTGAPELLRTTIPRLATGEKVAPAVVPATNVTAMTIDKLRAVEGVYTLGSGLALHLRVRDATLYANNWVLIPIDSHTFFSPRDYGVVTPVPGPSGPMLRLDWKVGADTWPAPRTADLPAVPAPEEDGG